MIEGMHRFVQKLERLQIVQANKLEMGTIVVRGQNEGDFDAMSDMSKNSA